MVGILAVPQGVADKHTFGKPRNLTNGLCNNKQGHTLDIIITRSVGRIRWVFKIFHYNKLKMAFNLKLQLESLSPI